MGFFDSFKKSFSSSMEESSKSSSNMFEGKIHTPPPKVTYEEKHEQLNARKRKEAIQKQKQKNISEVMNIFEDDEQTKDMERLVKYENSAYVTQQVQFRKAVLEKYEEEDGYFTCAHCGKRFKADKIEADHVIPRSIGGSFSIVNGQILCKKCNLSKLDDDSETDYDLMRILEEDEAIKEDDKEFLAYVQNMKEFKDSVNEFDN